MPFYIYNFLEGVLHMPTLRFWLHCLGELLKPFLTTMVALWTDAMVKGTRVPLYGYLIALSGGIIAAWMEGAKTWPTGVPPRS